MSRFQLIEVRKLAAVDMAWLGTQLVLAEYALGVVLPVALGLMSLRSGLAQPGLGNWQTLLGAWLVTIAANYVPLFLYALAIVRGGTVQQEGLPELKHVRRYRIQQAMILVPFLVAAVAFAQERRHRQQQPE
jgi:hypothetical protein